MGLMYLWSEVRLCRVIHYTGQREVVLLYTDMVICCTKDSSSGPFTVEDRGHALRGNALYKTIERQDYSRQRTDSTYKTNS